MLKKELTAALVIIGAMAPFAAQADQPMQAQKTMQASSDAQPAFAQGEKLRTGDLPAGYNQAANFMCQDAWDLSFTANYLYWKLSADMDQQAVLVSSTSTDADAVFNGTGTAVAVNPTYKSGFQVGMGLALKGMDDWNLYGEYTWYQNKAHHSATAGSGQLLVLDPSVTPSRYDILTATDLESAYRLHYNAADLSLQRTFYNGKKLTATFGAGLRGLWLSQHYKVSTSGLAYLAPEDDSVTSEAGSLVTKRELKSWALGPRFTLGSNWLLGYGFRLMGDMAANVLYTRYTEQQSSDVSSLTNLSVSAPSNYNTLRAITETSLGLGWGAYCGDHDEFHFDLSASYEFNVFWNQSIASMNGGSGNFYLQGLNVALRLDF